MERKKKDQRVYWAIDYMSWLPSKSDGGEGSEAL
jgi:hypothetical protein